MARPELVCVGCKLHPDELPEYVEAAEREECTPDQYVWWIEATLNHRNGHFLCTECYIAAGRPTTPEGWPWTAP